jgi:hypothetical protein
MIMGWFSFQKKVSPVPVVPFGRGAFAFRATEGAYPDVYPNGTPFPPANNQYTFFNAIPGNQLPSTAKYMVQGVGQYAPVWQNPTNAEQRNAHQNANSGMQVLRFGQQQSASFRQQQSANWQALYYNGGV